MSAFDPRFHLAMGQMLSEGQPFAVATVIAIRGSSSGKPGDKALFDREGRNVFGWVGGGCVERLTGEQAVASIVQAQPRVVVADLNDELLGLGMPCGGEMEIYIEPVLPRPEVVVAGEGALAHQLVDLAVMLGMPVLACGPDLKDRWWNPLVTVHRIGYDKSVPTKGSRVLAATENGEDGLVLAAALHAQASFVGVLTSSPHGEASRDQLLLVNAADPPKQIRVSVGLDIAASTPVEHAIATFAELLAVERGETVDALERVRGMGPALCPPPWEHPELVIIGHSRISEALAHFGVLLGWPTSLHVVRPSPHQRLGYPKALTWIQDDPGFEQLPAGPRSAVIVASHHKGDEAAITKALRLGAPYVGLIASGKRSHLIRERLPSFPGLAGVLRAPAGLALGATAPAEIALSVIVEVLALQRGRTGLPLSSLFADGPSLRAGCPSCGEGET
jgi:xanthine dehydrogenase accessory factor